MVALNKLRVKKTEYNESVTCRYIIHIIMPSWSDLGITTYQDSCCSRILLFGFLGPVRDVSVAFVIRGGGALWRISELLSQLIFSMSSGMFFFDCNSEYVVLTRSWLKQYEINNIVK